MTDVAQQQSRLKDLIAKGKEQGYITYAEVNDHLPDDISDPDQIEDIIRMINDMGITVYESAPDADELLSTEENTADELAAEEAAAALADERISDFARAALEKRAREMFERSAGPVPAPTS